MNNRHKIDYGISLGNDYAVIARTEDRYPVVIKSTGFEEDRTPCCVHYNKKQTLQVGKKAYGLLNQEAISAFKKNDATLINTFIEFKRTMGTDEKYESINMGKSFSSEELSAEVLKALKGYIRETDKSKIQLKLSYQSDTVETKVNVGVRVLRDKIEGDVPEKLFVELKHQDKGWTSGKVELKEDAEIIDILLETGKSNGFEIVIYDEKGTEYPCEPESFSIIQGFKTAGATLPFCVCVDLLDTEVGKQQLTAIKGLSKNQTLPAKGREVYKTQNDVRPGNKSDQIRIPVYYGEAGTKAIYNLDGLRGEVIITGENLPGMLPKGSDVELSIKIDESGTITVSASFPYLDDHIVENVIKIKKRKMPSKEEIEKRLKKANDNLSNLEEEYPEVDQIKIEEIRFALNKLSKQLDMGGAEADTREEIFGQININMIVMDKLESDSEWPKVMQELTEALKLLNATENLFSRWKHKHIIIPINEQVKSVIEKNDIRMAKDLKQQIDRIENAILDE